MSFPSTLRWKSPHGWARRQAMRQTGLPPEKIGVIFISPCPAKVTAVRKPLGSDHSEIDLAVPVSEVYPLLLSAMKKVAENPAELSTSGRMGIGWGRSGGGGRRHPSRALSGS